MMVEFPPVETDLLGLVDLADQQADPDREEFDFRERDLDIAGDDEAFVENAVENVDEPGCAPVPLSQWHRHSFGILRAPPAGPASRSLADANGSRSISAMRMPAPFVGVLAHCLKGMQQTVTVARLRPYGISTGDRRARMDRR